MSKVASAANLMGVGEDQLAAMLSTVVSVTREAPETVGSALKTIFARINDIKAGVAEDGATLGRFSGQMADYGFNVLDANGHLRDMGEVIEEIGGKWETLGREQQVALSQIMGGKYQYSRLLSLFDNFDQYNTALETAREAEGTLQEQQDIYMESTAAHLQTLKAAIENIFDSFLNTDSINTVVDTITGLANGVASFVDSVGGGGQILESLGAIGVNVFSQQIAKGINTTITNFEISNSRALELKQTLDTLEKWQSIPGLEKTTQDLFKNREQLIQLSRVMTDDQFSGAQKLLDNITQVSNKISILTQQKQVLEQTAKSVLKVEDAYKALNIAMKDQQAQQNIITQLEKQEGKFKNLSTLISNYIEKFKSINTEGINFQQEKDKLQRYLNLLETLQSQEWVKAHEQQIQSLRQSLTQLSENGIHKELLVSKLQGIATEIGSLTEISGNTARTIREQLTQEFEETVKSYRRQIEELKQQNEKLKGDLGKTLDNAVRTQTIENYAKLAGGIASVGMSIQQVQHLGSIWKNSDLSTGEKLLQTVTNLAFTLPMLVSGLKTVATTMGLATVTTYESAAAAAAAGKGFAFLNTTIELSPILGLIAAITALVTVISLYEKKQQQLREEEKALNDENIEKEKQKQTEIENNQELLKSLKKLDQQYKNGQITRNELKSTVQDLIDQYKLEGKEADNLANSYANLSEYIQETSLKQKEALKDSFEREKNAAESNLKLAAQDNGLLKPGGNIYISSSMGGIDENKKILSELTKAGFDIQEAYGDYATGFESQYATIKADLKDGEDIVEFYEKIQKTIQNIEATDLDSSILAKSDYYKSLKNILKGLSNAYNEYKDSAEAAEKAAADFAVENNIKNDSSLNFKDIQNMQDYLEKRETLIKKLKQQNNIENTVATERVDSFLQENFNDLYNKYNKTADYIDQLKDHLGDTEKNIDDLINQLNDEQLTALMGISPEDLESWDQWQFILDKIANTDFSNFKDLDVDIDALQENASNNYTFFQSLEDQVKSGKGVSSSTLSQLDEMLPEEDVTRIKEYFDMMSNGTYKMFL